MGIRWRSVSALSLAAIMTLSLAACGGDGGTGAPAGSAGSAQPSGGAGSAQMSDTEKWAEENGLNKTESVEELYEAAKAEGKVVVYSISSRMKKVKDSFEKQYPGVQCEPFDISQNELLEKITREYESDVRNCDVVHCKEMTGGLYNDFIKPGMFHPYRPEDIVQDIERKDFLERYLPMYYESAWWYYNDEVNPDGPPISSWWDLTKPEWKGKFFMNDPMENESNMALLTVLQQHSDELEADYEKVFGEKLVLSDGCENAAQEYIVRLRANMPMFESSSGKIVENIGIRGQKTAPIGYGSTVKLRERKDQDWALMPIPNFTPGNGMIGMNTLNIVNEAPHPAAAKLLVRWIMGEADGQGEGFIPFNSPGGWSSRSSVPPAEDTMPINEVPILNADYDYIYNNLQSVSDFWLSAQP